MESHHSPVANSIFFYSIFFLDLLMNMQNVRFHSCKNYMHMKYLHRNIYINPSSKTLGVKKKKEHHLRLNIHQYYQKLLTSSKSRVGRKEEGRVHSLSCGVI